MWPVSHKLRNTLQLYLYIDYSDNDKTAMMREPVDSLKQHEQERLLKTSTEDSIEKDHHQIEEISEGIDPSPPPSHVRQWVLVITVSTLWILVLIVETFLFSFYPGIAKMKGLSHTSIGAVFTAYEITRFAANPICGSMVRDSKLLLYNYIRLGRNKGIKKIIEFQLLKIYLFGVYQLNIYDSKRC